MSEANEPIIEAVGSGLNTASMESGAVLLDRIAATPPQAEPVLVKMRTEKAEKPQPVIQGEGQPAWIQDNSGEATVLRVDPKDYAHVQDHKGRPFDPTIHKVKPDGSPDFNARGKVKMLGLGERNPVRLILDPLAKLMKLNEPGRPQIECEAQAAAVIDSSKIRTNAECIADLYCGTGYILRGGKFTKRWDKERRPRIVNGLVNFEQQEPGTLMKVAPWVVLVHIFATDIVTVEGGERFDSGGGLIGLIQRFRQRRKGLNQPHAEFEAGTGASDAT